MFQNDSGLYAFKNDRLRLRALIWRDVRLVAIAVAVTVFAGGQPSAGLSRMWRSLAQQTQPVTNDEQAGSHICEDGHPHRADTDERQHKENGLDA